MDSMNTYKIISSSIVKDYGIFVTITDVESGFRKGVILKSISAGLYWEVEERILFSEKEIRFEGETETRVHVNYRNISDVQNEFDKNIFEYKIKSIGHNEKPLKDDSLIRSTTLAIPKPLKIIDIYDHYLLLKVDDNDTGLLHKRFIGSHKDIRIGDYVQHSEHKYHDLVDENGNFIYR
jgi:hypothetical protein